MMNDGWREPHKDILNYHKTVIRWLYEAEDGFLEEGMDIFIFEPIRNLFISKSSAHRLKFTEIGLWYPIPNIDKEI